MSKIAEIDSWYLFESGELTPEEYEKMEQYEIRAEISQEETRQCITNYMTEEELISYEYHLEKADEIARKARRRRSEKTGEAASAKAFMEKYACDTTCDDNDIPF